MIDYKQHIGKLFTITFISSWPIYNATMQIRKIIKNGELVMLLEYYEPLETISPNSFHAKGVVKVITSDGYMGYVPVKFIETVEK